MKTVKSLQCYCEFVNKQAEEVELLRVVHLINIFQAQVFLIKGKRAVGVVSLQGQSRSTRKVEKSSSQKSVAPVS